MNTLPLAPLPCETSDESRGFRRIGSEGFIDEQAVSRVIARGAYDRTSVQPAGMALCASGDDFAGWALPVASPFRELRAVAAAPASETKVPAAPVLRARENPEEPGIDAPYHGGHRWWIFGLCGAMTCGILSLTLFSLAPRQGDGRPVIAPYSGNQATAPVSVDKRETPPSLTKVLAGER